MTRHLWPPTAGGGTPSIGIGDLTDVTITSALNGQRLIYDISSGQWINGNYERVITVAKSGGNFDSIQDAIDYVKVTLGDAATDKRYVIEVHPGEYTENLTLADWVYIRGVNVNSIQAQVILNGTITGTAVNSSLYQIEIRHTPANSTDHAVEITNTTESFSMTQVVVVMGDSNLDINPNAVKLNGGSNAFVDSAVFYTNTFAATVNQNPIAINGASQNLINRVNIIMTTNTLSGDDNIITDNSTVSSELLGVRVQYSNTNASYSGETCCICTTGASSALRSNTTMLVRATGAGSGDFALSKMNTSGANGDYDHKYVDCQVSGFENNYVTETGDGDSQHVHYFVSNVVMDKLGDGYQIATPYDDSKSGFLGWVDSGNYWSISGNLLTLERGGYGMIQSVPRNWNGSQNVTLTADASNYVYVDDEGTVQITTSPSSSLFLTTLPLLEVYYDGTFSIVVRENHPYSFNSSVSSWAHQSFGVFVSQEGAIIDKVGTGTGASVDDRKVEIVGEGQLFDHGIQDTIPDSGGVGVDLYQMYTNAAGAWRVSALNSELQIEYDNAGTPTTIPSNRYGVYRILVSKNDLNTTTPKYFAIMNDSVYTSANAARTAIASGVIPNATGALANLELATLGYVIINGGGTGGYIDEVVVSKKTAVTGESGGSATTAAGISTDVINFNNLLSGAESTVQLALDIIDNLDPSSASALSIAGTNATSVTIAQSGVDTNILGTLTVDELLTADDIDSAGATLNIGGTTASTINIGRAGGTVNLLGAVNNVNATNVNVPNDLDVDGLLTADGGIDRSSAADLAIGATNATGVVVTPTLYLESGLDSEGSIILNIGVTNATEINIGRSGVLTDIQGTLSVNEAATFDSTVGITGVLSVDNIRVKTATGSQAFQNSSGTEVGSYDNGGDWTFNGTITAKAVVGRDDTPSAGEVGETITDAQGTLQSITTDDTDTDTQMSVTLTQGVWLLSYNCTVGFFNGDSSRKAISVRTRITDSSNTAVSSTEILCRDNLDAGEVSYHCASAQVRVVVGSGGDTYKVRFAKGGTASNTLLQARITGASSNVDSVLTNPDASSLLQAVRIA